MKTNRLLTLFGALALWLLCTAALTGCGRLAGPIVLPDAADIVCIELRSGGESRTCSDRGWIAAALEGLSQAAPTRRESIQDAPRAAGCVQLNFCFAQGASTVFLYRQGGQCFVEQPYQGIWAVEEGVYRFLLGEAG